MTDSYEVHIVRDEDEIWYTTDPDAVGHQEIVVDKVIETRYGMVAKRGKTKTIHPWHTIRWVKYYH